MLQGNQQVVMTRRGASLCRPDDVGVAMVVVRRGRVRHGRVDDEHWRRSTRRRWVGVGVTSQA